VTAYREAAAAAAARLRSSGFRRRANEFAKSGSAEFVSVIGFYPDGDGFAIQYGVVSPGLLAFRAARGVAASKWPSTSDALLCVVVFHPGYQRGDRSDLFPYRWRSPAVRDEDVPARLEEALVGQVLPDLEAWNDPQLLAAALAEDRPGSFPGLPTLRAVAMALYESASSAESDHALKQLDEDDPVRRWIEAQLRAHTT
jgi:hypothetical protein